MSSDERENLGNEDRKESPATEAAVRSKIRAVVQERDPQAKFNSIMDCLYHLVRIDSQVTSASLTVFVLVRFKHHQELIFKYIMRTDFQVNSIIRLIFSCTLTTSHNTCNIHSVFFNLLQFFVAFS